MEYFRGVVISPGFRSTGSNGFAVNTSGVLDLLRQCLLYWDKIEWPINNLVALGGGPDVDFLVSTGALQRTRVQMVGAFPGDMTPWFAEAQLKVFDQLETANPGLWALSQESDALRFPGQAVAVMRALECSLFQVLPVPGELVPFQDVLEFRARYAVELQALRKAMDELYLHVAESPDPSRARVVVVGDLTKATADVEKAFSGVGILHRRVDCTIDIKPSSGVTAAIATGKLAESIGLPFELGASIGGVLSTLTLRLADVPTPSKVKAGPFAYLYHARRELAATKR
jgi:uncharacterized protein DUF6236